MAEQTSAAASSNQWHALPFHRRVDEALGNDTLQKALGHATSRFVANRAVALSSLADVETLRDQARAIRAGALARLDDLLERLADGVEARGGRVCWAPDAAAARQYIVDLARARGL